MIDVRTLTCNPLQENCYVVTDRESGETAVIDCGAYYDAERQAIAGMLSDESLELRDFSSAPQHSTEVSQRSTLNAQHPAKVSQRSTLNTQHTRRLRHVLCTHAHFDHVFGVDTLYERFGVKPRLHSADNFLYDNMDGQLNGMMGMGFGRTMPPRGDSLHEGERIPLGRHQLTVLHTPGHSPGSVVFYIEDEKMLFAGDTLFRMSVGRTDLQGGSWQQLMQSISQVLAKLPDDVTVYTGHGPATRIGDEKRMNPYFKC